MLKLGTKLHHDALLKGIDSLDAVGCFALTELGYGRAITLLCVAAGVAGTHQYCSDHFETHDQFCELTCCLLSQCASFCLPHLQKLIHSANFVADLHASLVAKHDIVCIAQCQGRVDA